MKKFLCLLVFMFIISCKTAYAGVVITEVMYDVDGADTDREWIEIYNNGSSPVDLTGWKFFENNSNHALTALQGTMSLQAGEYAIIAQNLQKFLADNPGVTGLILKASFSLNNDPGETLTLKDQDLNSVDQITYESSRGAGGDGNSLQKNSAGDFVAASPSPGSGASLSSASQTTTTTTSSSSQTQTVSGGAAAPPASSRKVEPTPDRLIADITAQNSGIVGVPITFSARVHFGKEEFSHGYYVWSLGDGEVRSSSYNQPFEYTYAYSGEYVVMFNYFFNAYDRLPQATDRMILKIVPAGVSISSIGSDGRIELSNTSSFEMDVSNWKLQSSAHAFIIPRSVIILPNKKIILSPVRTGFDSSTTAGLQLLNPQGEVESTYEEKKPEIKQTESEIRKGFPVTLYKEASHSEAVEILNNEKIEPSSFDVSSQEASVILATSKESQEMSYTILGVFAGLIGLALASVFILKKLQPQPEEELRAKDFEIIE